MTRCLSLTLLVWMTAVSFTVPALTTRRRRRRRREGVGLVITRQVSAGAAGWTHWRRKLKSIFWFRSGQLESALQTFYNNSIVGLSATNFLGN